MAIWEFIPASFALAISSAKVLAVIANILIVAASSFPEERLALLTEAEEHRPACLRCGVKLKFGRVQQLDNTPIRDGMFTETFDVQPAYCEACGKIEFYHPDYVARNKFWAFLAEKDTEA